MSNVYELTSKNIDRTKLTPMLKQYMDVKDKHQGIILFYRLGDFYETFLEDAITTSKALEITLTSRDAGENGKIAMAGIPAKAVQNYLQKLLTKGYKVAICEQIEDPALAKGLVKREVTRTISAGTIVEQEYLDANKNNYIASLIIDKNTFAVAYSDISTGEFKITQSDLKNLEKEITRIEPVEIICKSKKQELKAFQIVPELVGDVPKTIRDNFNCTIVDNSDFDFNNGAKIIKEIFKVDSLEGFGYPDYKLALCAAGALLLYIKSSQKDNMSKFDTIKPYSIENFMSLDYNAQRGLELTTTIRDNAYKGSLLSAINKTSTPMGSRLLRSWLKQPLLDVSLIERRQDSVEELFNNPKIRMTLNSLLNKVYDIERLATKITNNSVNARDYLSLKDSLKVIPEINEILKNSNSYYLKAFHNERTSLMDFAEIIDKTIENDPPTTIMEGGIIKEGVNQELDYQRNLLKNGEQWLKEFEAKEKQKTGISSLKVGFSKTFGYFLEVTNTNKDLVPAYFVRKQTLTNAERYITEELKSHEDEVLNAQNKSMSIEYNLFCDFRNYSQEFVAELRLLAYEISALDVLLSFANCAAEYNYVRPIVDNSDDLIVKNGRHPVIEQILPLGTYVPNDLQLQASQKDKNITQFMILTGPNMAGKSTYMRQNAIISILAQMGSFVPASYAKIGVIDKIFTRIGASDDLSTGQSTFMVEMLETANILNFATEKSLILLDEIGRGTSTYDGVAIAWSVCEFLATKIKARAIFATHYHELNIMADSFDQIKNYKVTVNEENNEIEFLRKVVEGSTSKSYGIQVAKMAGLPNTVVSRALTLINRIQKDNQAQIKVQNQKEVEVKTAQLSLFVD
ncbi:MAG: DNA mismatch repair protein MutS [Candidatus Gastranaerophilales bacterium]|nr:DNA mismatch repair protein MutS [Candidatus Gastranaerophilales bacterium]